MGFYSFLNNIIEVKKNWESEASLRLVALDSTSHLARITEKLVPAIIVDKTAHS